MEQVDEHTENMKQIQDALATPVGAAADFDEVLYVSDSPSVHCFFLLFSPLSSWIWRYQIGFGQYKFIKIWYQKPNSILLSDSTTSKNLKTKIVASQKRILESISFYLCQTTFPII